MNKLALNNVGNEFGIEESKASQIKQVFDPMIAMLETFEEKYNGIIVDAEEEVTEETTKRARELRLSIKKVRIDADKAHKDLKAETLRYGRAVDGVRNILKYAVVEKEENLNKIEKHFEIIEKARIEKLEHQRVEEISKYIETTDGLELGKMSDESWKIFLDGAKSRYEAEKKAEKEAEDKKAEQLRKEKEENEKIRKENERLKAESEKIRKEKEELEKKAKEEKTKKEQEENAKLNAPDKDKLAYLQSQISNIEMPEVSNSHSIETVKQVKILLSKVVNYIDIRKGKM